MNDVAPAPTMQALHHVTMITADAQRNVDFLAGVLGLRLVKKTVNFDAPQMYHLYYGDDAGSPGTILTWFEIRGAGPGRAGAGMVHRIDLGVASEASLDFWQQRLETASVDVERSGSELHFTDPDGLALAIVVSGSGNAPLRAASDEIPAEHAIGGIEAARAYRGAGDDHELLVDTFGFTPVGDGAYVVEGESRRVGWAYDDAPAEPGIQGSGTAHHIAWCSRDADHATWREREEAAGLPVSRTFDRDYFDAIYARMPSGILFEVATEGPGFAVDEAPGELGRELRVPKMHAPLRDELERTLTPLKVPGVRA